MGPMIKKHVTNISSHTATVYIQIFKACKFQGCHKSSIFAILFLRITKYPALWFMQVKVCQQNFEDENFTDGQFTAKTSKITSLENLYVCGIQYSSQTHLVTSVPTHNGRYPVTGHTELSTTVIINVFKCPHVTITSTRDHVSVCTNTMGAYKCNASNISLVRLTPLPSHSHVI